MACLEMLAFEAISEILKFAFSGFSEANAKKASMIFSRLYFARVWTPSKFIGILTQAEEFI